MEDMILAGDIGGTHTRLAIFENGKKVVAEKKYLSSQYTSLEQIAREYLSAKRVKKACFGIAGPVKNGVCRATNIPWVVNSAKIAKELKIPSVHLMNDLEANAYGIKELKADELFLLHKGNQRQKGNRAVISAGTGLGEAGLYWDGKKHHPFASEGGHADFAPRNELEIELFLFLNKRYPHVSYERVVSGPGLYAIYQFLTQTGREKKSPAIEKQMALKDPSAVVSEWGKKGKDAACAHALDLFVSLYGAEAGNVALKFMALGGVYIGGGIAPNILEKLKEGFAASFIDKGRFKSLLKTIPVWVILNDNAALIGAATYGAEM